MTANVEDVEGDRQTVPPKGVGLLETWEGGEIEASLERNSTLGLCGMGGIGKTTLCKAIFNRKRSNFEFTLFVEEVKGMPGENNIDFVEKLLERVHHRGRKVEKISDKSFLRGKDLLVVLDDVDSEDDRDIRLVHELQDFCSPNSRFILTSRNRQILNRVHNISIVEVPLLDGSSSERLFRSYAIPSSCDVPLLEWQQKCLLGIVKHCGGLPLVLEVVGKYLKTSGERALWEQTLTALVDADDINAVGLHDFWSKLKVSYDRLEDEEKHMFIDAATFFQENIFLDEDWPHSSYRRQWSLRQAATFFQENIFLGEDWPYSSYRRQWSLRQARAVWGRTYGREAQRWRKLVDRSLVYDVTEDSAIKMHEHLIHLGQRLAMKERIRIEESDPKSLSDALHKKQHQLQEIHTIQSLSRTTKWEGSCLICVLKGYTACPHHIPRINLMGREHEMKNLQYLQLDNCAITCGERCIFPGREKVILPPSLVICRCVNIGQNMSFATCTNLVILLMRHVGPKDCPTSVCNLKNLQILCLEATDLKCLPELFGRLGNLRKLTLRSCYQLERLPDSFGSLNSLQALRIIACIRLVELPDSFSDLESLQMLNIHLELVWLLDSFGSLKSLQKLDIVNCPRLATLPESFCGLKSLQEMQIHDCQGFVELPDSFGGLKNLQILKLFACKRLVRLPDSFRRLKNLQVFRLYGCKRLVRLPDFFGGLENLQLLQILDCEGFPDSFGRLKNLRVLKLYGSAGLVELPDSFGGLENLRKSQVDECWSLMSGKVTN